MIQKKFPCCKKPMGMDDVFNMIEEAGDSYGSSTKNVTCPNCKKALTVYLDIDSVEVDD